MTTFKHYIPIYALGLKWQTLCPQKTRQKARKTCLCCIKFILFLYCWCVPSEKYLILLKTEIFFQRCNQFFCNQVYCNCVIVEAIRYANIRYMFYSISFTIFVINNKRVNRCLIIIPVKTLNGFLNNKREISWKSRVTTKLPVFELSLALLKAIRCKFMWT